MSIDKRKLSKNLFTAFAAQLVIFAVSAIMSLVVPKLLGVEEFGYWQLFLLYSSYVALFHFGLNDGVYLLAGGKSFHEMNSSSINSQFLVGVCFESLLSLALFLFVFANFGFGPRSFVVGAFAIFIVIFNLGAYWGAVCQAANETNIYSKMMMIDRCAFLVPLLIGVFFGIAEFEYYIISYIASRCLAALYIMFRCRGLLRAPLLGFVDSLAQSFESIKVGIKLTISYSASVFVLGAGRFIADGVWGIEEFGQLSFALSLLNFFIVFVNQVGMVLFPALRKVDASEFKQTLFGLTALMDWLLPVFYVVYYPISLLAEWWLPQYALGFQWLSILLPICVYNCRMEVISTTSMKVLRKETSLMFINVGFAALSFVCACLSGYVIGDMQLLLWAMVIPVIARSVFAEVYVNKIISLKCWKSIGMGLIFSCIYLASMMAFGSIAAVGFVALTYLFFVILRREELLGFVSKLRKKQH